MNIYLLAFLLVTSFISSPANATLIDDFNGGDMTVYPTSSISEKTKIYAHAFGGKRTINIEKTGPRTAYSDVMFGQYSLNTSAGTSAVSTITWNSATGVDLIESTNNNVFFLEIDFIDQRNTTFNLFITDTSAKTGGFSLLNAGTGIQAIYFSSFLGVDFHNINEISLQIVSGLEADLLLNALSTSSVGPVSSVPTPAAFLLFSSSLVMLISFRRR